MFPCTKCILNGIFLFFYIFFFIFFKIFFSSAIPPRSYYLLSNPISFFVSNYNLAATVSAAFVVASDTDVAASLAPS